MTAVLGSVCGICLVAGDGGQSQEQDGGHGRVGAGVQTAPGAAAPVQRHQPHRAGDQDASQPKVGSTAPLQHCSTLQQGAVWW